MSKFGKFKRVSVALPLELVTRVDEKAAKEGLTRQQLLTSLVDLGLRGSIWPNATAEGVIGPLKAVELLQVATKNSGSDLGWSYRHLRDALWAHLGAMVGGK